jgi:hypothetical protein
MILGMLIAKTCQFCFTWYSRVMPMIVLPEMVSAMLVGLVAKIWIMQRGKRSIHRCSLE